MSLGNFDEDARNDPLLAEYERARGLLQTLDWLRGLREMERLAHSGSIMSMLRVADAMRKGWGYEQDLPGAEAWYKVAVESGSARGLFGLGLTHLRMDRFDEAIQDLEAAIARDYPPAYNALACIYFNGNGVSIDRPKAKDLWRKGISLDSLSAKRNLVQQSLHGRYGFSGRMFAIVNFLPTVIEISIIQATSRDTDRLR